MASNKAQVAALGLVLIGAIAVVSTGAFQSVEADRNADVSVSGDASALLSLDGNSNNAFVADAGSGSEFEIDLSGEQLNGNAGTDAGKVVNVTNAGQDAVGLDIDLSGVTSANVGFYVNASSVSGSAATTLSDTATTFDAQIDGSAPVVSADDTNVELGPGESIEVFLFVEVTDGVGSGGSLTDGEQVLDSITFVADQDLTGGLTVN